MSSLEFGDWENIYDSVVEPQLNEYACASFEDMCIDWLRVQNRNHRLPFIFTQIGRWWDKNTEIDIIAANEDKSELIIAECKFHNSVVNDSALEKHLLKNLSSLKKKENASIHYWYFSLAGFTEQAKTLFQENHKKTFCFFHYRYKKLYSLSLANHLVIFLLILILLHNNHHNDVLK